MTFNNKESFNRTVAHELGHGAFTWQHPFDEPFKTIIIVMECGRGVRNSVAPLYTNDGAQGAIERL